MSLKCPEVRSTVPVRLTFAPGRTHIAGTNYSTPKTYYLGLKSPTPPSSSISPSTSNKTNCHLLGLQTTHPTTTSSTYPAHHFTHLSTDGRVYSSNHPSGRLQIGQYRERHPLAVHFCQTPTPTQTRSRAWNWTHRRDCARRRFRGDNPRSRGPHSIL